MNPNFNSNEFKSYEELPEEHKQNFEAIEGGKGFVLKSVEKNPEVAQRLAVIEDKAINTLRQEIENNNLSFDDLLSSYRAAAKKYNYEEKNKAAELLKQISDFNILRGGNYDERLTKEFEENYQQLTYSQKTQKIILENLDKQDLEVATNLLLDDKFSMKDDLLKKFEGDKNLWELYKQTQGNLGIANLIVEKTKNPALKVKMLKDLIQSINKIADDKAREERLVDYSLMQIKKMVAESLLEKGDQDQVLSLMDEEYLEAHNLFGKLPEIESDLFLYDLAIRSKNESEVMKIFKFIADKEIFVKIIQTKGEEFKKLDGDKKSAAVTLAQKLEKVLANQPEIYQAADLRENNKFIVGVPSGEDKLFIAWSNTQDHKYHNDIFESLSRYSGEKFPEKLRSGGYIKFDHHRAVLCDSSGDFGNYGHRVLDLFREKIQQALREKLGDTNLELKIEVST